MSRNTKRPVARAMAIHYHRHWLAAGLLASGLIVTAGAARAESVFAIGAGPTTANAHLDFQVIIPRFIFLQVGTGTSFATNPAIDLLKYTVPATNVGDGTVISATSGGDISAGVVTAKVVGNNFTASPVSFTATTLGALSDGAGDSISWSQFTVAVATLTSLTALPHPGSAAAPFTDGAATSVSLTPVAKVINQDAKWTFKYSNTVIAAAGTYGSTGTGNNNGRVTYSVTMP
jgi:hypothetical protein